jgi:GNAT superfamily N-acetyltransferase
MHNDWELGVNPGDPPVGLDEYLARRRRATQRHRAATAVGFLDAEPVALAVFDLLLGVNSHLLDVQLLHVAAARRRRGVGSKMLRSVAAHGEGLGHTSLVLWANDDAGTAFCEHHDMAHQTTERHSRLSIDDVDDSQQAAWATGKRAVTAGYHLVRLGDHCQDELLEAACAAENAEADAPTGDLDYTHHAIDPDGMRADEADLRAAGLESFRVLAVAGDGAGAGISELAVNSHRPQLGLQGTTAVVADHRGHRIGRWLKAVNLLDARAANAELRTVTTTNAEANPWMLAINVAMGFRTHHIWRHYQASIAQLLA